MKREFSPKLTAAQWKFIEAGGNATQSFGFGRIIGQLFSLLYLSPQPLCLDEITAKLGVSKASVSTTIRQLENWSAVKRVWVKGDRKDYYEAETDFNTVIRNGLLSTLRKKLDTAGLQLDQVQSSLEETIRELDERERKDMEIVATRLQRAKKFHSKVSSLLSNPFLDKLL